jgi:hypothetical protein
MPLWKECLSAVYESKGMKQYNCNCFGVRKNDIKHVVVLFLPLFGLCHTVNICSENTVETGHM